jgi:hypothetical protein
MYLDEVKPRTQPASGHCGETVDSHAPASLPGGKWQTFPNSRISHHGAACCEIAHAWLLAFDFAQLNGGNRLAGPRWMREHSTWGPTAGRSIGARQSMPRWSIAAFTLPWRMRRSRRVA